MKSALLLVLVLLCVLSYSASAQTGERRGLGLTAEPDGAIDPEYITDLYDRFTVRIYGSNKFTRYSLGENGRSEDVLYKSNSSYNAGVGFNYRSLALNLGFRAPFFNNDNDVRGKTKFFDLQAYIYARKFNVDFYAQTYKGYYLAQSDVLGYRPSQRYLLRPDLRTRNIGLNIERILNPRRYSFRAAYLQNEYQQRSAGTFLVGGGAHYLHVTADSAIMPAGLADGPLGGAGAFGGGFRQSRVASLAVHGGYAHTLVISRHLFLMGQLMVGVGGNYTWLSDDVPSPDEEPSGAGFHLNGIARAGLGYQGNEWFAGLYFVTNLWHNPTPIDGTWQRYETGMVRFAVARHFELSAKTAEKFNRYEPEIMRRR